MAAVAPRPEETVIEIGAGQGAITGLLSASGCRLVVVEIDRRMTAHLRESFGQGNVEIVEGDFLDLPLSDFARRSGGKLRIVGNIPYHLTSPILFRIFSEREAVADFTLMVQREVARRIVAPPGSRTYGILSVMTRLHGVPEILFDVSASCFYPKPKVTSSILRVGMTEHLPEGLDIDLFRKVVRTAFGKRRKTLRNSLMPFWDTQSPSGGPPSGCPVSLELRPEALAVDDFILLTHYINALR